MTNNKANKHSTKITKDGKKTYIVNSFFDDESKRTLQNIMFALMLRELEKDK